MKSPVSCSGPVSRRDFLQIGGLTLGGLGAAGIVPWKVQATERVIARPTQP